jgi:hypothetical protein
VRRALAAGTLALSSLACRRHQPPPVDCLHLDAPAEPVGFGAAFTIAARLDCPEARGGRIAWRQIGGAPLSSMSAARDGFQIDARMPALADGFPGGVPWGVVPLSPRTRDEVVLRATWTGGDGAPIARPAQHARRRSHLPRRQRLARHGAPRGQPRGAGRGGRNRDAAARRGGRLATRRRRRSQAGPSHRAL